MKTLKRGSFDVLAKYLKDFGEKKPFNFFITEDFLITWPGAISGNVNHISKQDFGVRIIPNDAEMDQNQFIRAPPDYDITHSTIECSVSDSGKFLHIMFQNTAHFMKKRKLEVYALPTKQSKFFKEIPVLDRRQSVRLDKEGKDFYTRSLVDIKDLGIYRHQGCVNTQTRHFL